jgi:hypothetical protein
LDIDVLANRLADALAEKLRADQERLLGREDLAERIGVSVRSIGSMVGRGDLPQPLLHTAGVARWSWDQVLKHLAARQGRKLRRGRGIKTGQKQRSGGLRSPGP